MNMLKYQGLFVLVLIFSTCFGKEIRESRALAIKEARAVTKRNVGALEVAKLLVDSLLVAGSIAFPPLGIAAVAVSFFWPSGQQDVFTQIKSEVSSLIDEKVKAEFFETLQLDVDGFRKVLKDYNNFYESPSSKLTKITTINTVLTSKRPHFQRYRDTLVSLELFVAYSTLHTLVKTEVYKLTTDASAKANRLRELLTSMMRDAVYIGDQAYGGYEEWRRSQFTCKWVQIAGQPIVMRNVRTKRERIERHYVWTWTDQITGASQKKNVFRPNSDYEVPLPRAWCDGFEKPIIDKIQPILAELRQSVESWASVFNVMASENAGTLGAMSLTSCYMGRGVEKSYFGHYNKDSNGRTCNKWTDQTRYTNFPMDNQNKTIASNYCRRTAAGDSRAWCYTGSTWGYCDIRACTQYDWN